MSVVDVLDKENTKTEPMQFVFRNKGIANPFYYGVVTSSICKESDLGRFEKDHKILAKFPLDNNGEAEKLCLETPIQYYIMAGFGDSLEGDRLNVSKFSRKIEQVSFMTLFATGGPNLNYEKFDLSILPPIGAYFAGVISTYVHDGTFLNECLEPLFNHLSGRRFLENLEKVGFAEA